MFGLATHDDEVMQPFLSAKRIENVDLYQLFSIIDDRSVSERNSEERVAFRVVSLFVLLRSDWNSNCCFGD